MTNSSDWLEIYLLCCNRPEFAKAAIQSILNQRASGFELIVSDNSSDDRVARMTQAEFPGVMLKRRGFVPVQAHINICIAEARSDYFCLFHDDDLMGPDFVSEMRLASEYFPDAVAIGANAWVVNKDKGMRVNGMSAFGTYQEIASSMDLFRRYFGRYQTGIVPFPGYIYRTAVAGKEHFPEAGGKYADVSWLLRLASLGRVVWVNKQLMDYHIHGGNDGLQESRRDRLSFLGLIKRCPSYANPTGVSDYRYLIYKKIIAEDVANSARQVRIERLRRFVRWQGLRRHLRISELPAMLRKKLLKWLAK